MELVCGSGFQLRYRMSVSRTSSQLEAAPTSKMTFEIFKLTLMLRAGTEFQDVYDHAGNPVLRFEVSSRHTCGRLSYEQNQLKKSNPKR
jgi:hypothetical protein